MISARDLRRMYVREKKSMHAIATQLNCSIHRVQYWLAKHAIPRRTASEAMYRWHNPDGDPFRFKKPRTPRDYILFGIGVGLYWGEGTKANRHAVRLGNSDPYLLSTFLDFLSRFFGIQRTDCRFGLQLFTDCPEEQALDFWTRKLKIRKHQFYKITRTRSGSIGTYRRKNLHGVVTIYYHNHKVRNLLVDFLPKETEKSAPYAAVAQR